MRKSIVSFCICLLAKSVSGQLIGGNGAFYDVLSVTSMSTAPAYYYIDTNIPATDAAAPQIQITGYMYANTNKAMKVTLGWYYYAGDFYWAQYQSDLGYNKPSRIRLGKYTKSGSDYIRIEIANNSVYWSNYTISATDRANYMGAYTGWTYTEGEMPAGTTSQIVTASQQVDVTIDGHVGIGTASSPSMLHVKGGEVLSAGWNNTATLEAKYPVQIFNSNNVKWAGVGYDFSDGLKFWVNGTSNDLHATGALGMTILNNGNIGVGTNTPTQKLSVNGNIAAKKITVAQLGWSDYVFDSNYTLRSLSSLEKYISKNKHLPEVPSAKEVGEKGISVGDNQALLLKKIEELTLYLITMQKQVDRLTGEIRKIKNSTK